MYKRQARTARPLPLSTPVRNLIEMAARKQAVRIAEKRHTLQLEDLQTLDEADFDV